MKYQLGLVFKSVFYTSLVVLFFAIQGCASKDFTPVNGGIIAQNPGGSSQGDPGGGGGGGTTTTGGTINTGGNPPGGNPPTGGSLPKLTIEEPLCGPNSMCPAYFVLTAPAAKVLTFQWRTNDTRYTTDPAHIGQPGVHYVSTSGSVTFQVGESRKPIVVQSLNINNMIVIPFTYFNCVYDNTPISCALLPL